MLVLVAWTHAAMCSFRVSPSRFAQENASVARHESAHLPRPPLLLLAQETHAPNSLPNVPNPVTWPAFNLFLRGFEDFGFFFLFPPVLVLFCGKLDEFFTVNFDLILSPNQPFFMVFVLLGNYTHDTQTL